MFSFFKTITVTGAAMLVFGCKAELSTQKSANKTNTATTSTSAQAPKPSFKLNGLPPGVTANSVFAITIAGEDITEYRYKYGPNIDCNADEGYSNSIPLSEPIANNFSDESDGDVTVCVQVRNGASLSLTSGWSDPVAYSFIKDTTPPNFNFDYDVETNVAFVPQSSANDLTKLSYNWKKVTGPGNISFDTQDGSPQITADTNGIYQIEVTVSDEAGNKVTKTLQFKWFSEPLSLELRTEGWDDPSPLAKLFAPLTNGIVQIYDNASCSGTPIVEAPSAAPVTKIEIPLTFIGSYTFYAKYKGAAECMTNGVSHNYFRKFEPGLTVTQIVSNTYAFAAIYSNGMVTTWGPAHFQNKPTGADSSSVASKLTGNPPVVEITPAGYAFAARRSDGSAVFWGIADADPSSTLYGLDCNGDSTKGDADCLENGPAITKIVSNGNSFAVIRSDGSVLSWGYNIDFSLVSADLDGTIDVVSIVEGQYSYAALRSDGSVITWGSASYGGSLSDTTYGVDCDQNGTKGDTCLDGTTPVVKIFATQSSYAALRDDGSVVTWGNQTKGGNSTGSTALLIDGTPDTEDVVDIVVSPWGAFTAIRQDGSIAVWGDSSAGGSISHATYGVDCNQDGTKGDSGCLVNVKAVNGGYMAFAAILSDDSVVTWGNEYSGGNSFGVKDDLTGTPAVVSITSTQGGSNGGMVALRSDGSVVSWGSTNTDTSSVAGSISSGVVEVLAAPDTSFAARKSDGSVVSWGSFYAGGDSSYVASEIDGTVPVTKVVPGSGSFAALRSDQKIITWGRAGRYTNQLYKKLNGDIPVISIATEYLSYGSQFGFVATRSDGSVVRWGAKSDSTLDVDSALDGSIKVTKVVSNMHAYAAIREDGSVITWPETTTNGGDSSAVSALLDGSIDVTEIVATREAFAAIRADGSVVAWGNPQSGGSTNDATYGADCNRDNTRTDDDCLDGSVQDVVAVYANYMSFAALRADGSVITWGHQTKGGNSNGVLDGLTGLSSLVASEEAFAAISATGGVLAWGNSAKGGSTSDGTYGADCDRDGSRGVNACLSSGVTKIAAGRKGGAMAAILSDGSVVSWGAVNAGGSVTDASFGLDCNRDTTKGDVSCIDGTTIGKDAVNIFATDYSFAVLKEDGSVITWGGPSGGDSNSVASSIDGSVAVAQIYASPYAYAALRADGSLVTWGNAGYGGDSWAFSNFLDGAIDVTKVIVGERNIAAIRADGSAAIWGLDNGQSALDNVLKAGVSDIVMTQKSGAIIKTDGSVVSYGDSESGGFLMEPFQISP